jgi:cell division protein FtsA
MVKESLVAGIDIGSNQVCCVVGAVDEDLKLVKVLSAALVACPEGIKSGAVVDIGKAADALRRAFKEAEKTAGGQIDDIVAAVGGQFIEANNSRGFANIHNREVSESIIDEALYSAEESIKIDSGKEIIQIVPCEYFLDGQKIQNPLQMEGTKIEINAIGFTANTVNLNNITKAMNIAEINCSSKIYSPMAVCDILLRQEEKESGCLLVDFGGYSTNIVQYEDGILKYTHELPVGSEHITKDLMRKLGTSYQESANIKINQGAAFCADEFEDREFEYLAADGVAKIQAYRREIVEEIITPRIEQILAFIEAVVKQKSSQSMPSNIILTGGGSKLEYLTTAFERYFDEARHFVRIGYPENNKVIGAQEIITNPVYSCAIGAIYSLLSNVYYPSDSTKFPFSDQVRQLINWFKGMF